ncbi:MULTISPECIES: acetate uptake transporter [unclassified Haladaptatus]|uniref:acetate uptake transporter n=1 Tax=unclassified Haladaptatus TaxID=2622732 RepID=UPI00209C20EB|nr:MULTISPECIES: acetate uptake transporter [unclassified Haladaptatus]MCO8246152.1 acetate uptake transporter [Haladaptatus sp. AB643]MCO8254228.1 acetate uptake transporter [Haladaptatus sp. AB618]
MPADTKTGNPAPLGLVGFGLTTVLLSMINAKLLPPDGEVVVIPMALAFGGTIQLFAGLLEYREGNTFGTVAFTSYGAFWWWWGLLVIFSGNGWISLDGATSTIGMALIMWGVFTTYMWFATFKLNWALWSVFLLLAVTFFLLGFGDYLGIGALVTAGGWVGLITGLDAMFVSFAEVANWAYDREVIPLGGAPLKSKSGRKTQPAD